MKHVLLFLCFLFISLVLQLLVGGLATGSAPLHLLFVLTLLWGYFRGWKEGVLAGFVAGLTKDFFFFPIVGIHAFSFVLVGLTAGEVRPRIYQQNVLFFAIVAAALYCLHTLIIALLTTGAGGMNFTQTAIDMLWPDVLWTTLASGVAFLAATSLHPRLSATP